MPPSTTGTNSPTSLDASPSIHGGTPSTPLIQMGTPVTSPRTGRATPLTPVPLTGPSVLPQRLFPDRQEKGKERVLDETEEEEEEEEPEEIQEEEEEDSTHELLKSILAKLQPQDQGKKKSRVKIAQDGARKTRPQHKKQTSDKGKVPVFKGTPSEDVRQWLRACEVMATISGWSEETTLTKMAQGMEGSAATWLYRQAPNTISTLRTFRRAIRETFSRLRTINDQKKAYVSARQQKGEDADIFASRVKDLAQSAGETSESLAVSIFVSGLRPELARCLEGTQFNTWDQALAKARKHERRLAMIQPHAAGVNVLAANNVMSTPTMTAQGDAPNPKRGRGRGQRAGFTVPQDGRQTHTPDGRPICFRCGEAGHISRGCFNTPLSGESGKTTAMPANPVTSSPATQPVPAQPGPTKSSN